MDLEAFQTVVEKYGDEINLKFLVELLKVLGLRLRVEVIDGK